MSRAVKWVKGLLGLSVISDADIAKMFDRSLAELQRGILARRALLKMEPTTQVIMHDSPVNFFCHIAMEAIQNDIWWRAFRVFDVHPTAKAWKYLRKRFPSEFKQSAKDAGTSLRQIKKVAAKLLSIRNKTRAHIDIESVRNPKSPYGKASGMERRQTCWWELDDLLHSAFDVMSRVYKARGGEPPSLDVYDASDVYDIIGAYERSYPGTALVRLRRPDDDVEGTLCEGVNGQCEV